MTEIHKILVWDWPVRIGHWLLVALFALTWLTGDSEEWRLVHQGETVLALSDLVAEGLTFDPGQARSAALHCAPLLAWRDRH
jgi:cytochrome b